jgi:hypothetical protein
VTFVAVLLWNLAALVPIGLGAWSVFGVLALYWFENLCTGLAQYCKLRDVEGHRGEEGTRFAPSAFFALHYGLFTLVHGVLVLAFFGIVAGGLWEDHAGWWISALLVAAMHVVHYQCDWRARGAWAHANADRLMAEPYARVAVLHVVLIAGGWLALTASEPRTVLLLFASVKLAAELAIAAVGRRRRDKAGALPMENFVSGLGSRKGRSHVQPR